MAEENKLPIENLSQDSSSVSDEPIKQPIQKENVPFAGNSVNGWQFVIAFAIITIIFLVLSIATEWESACVAPLFIVYIVLVVGIFSAYIKQETENEKASAEANALRKAREKYNSFKEQVSIPETAKEIIFYKSSANSPIQLTNSANKVYIWKSENSICFFPCTPTSPYSITLASLKIDFIPVGQIEYYSTRGEIFRENKISGGGGGGSSIGGAVAGGLIAGGTGAVIGSRKKVNEIRSELITHDTRETFLNYFDGNDRHTLFFDIYAYQIFNDLIPEKEFKIVNAIRSSEIMKKQIYNDSQKSVTDQLRELAKLRDDGIITENEFNEKKKQLLDKIT